MFNERMERSRLLAELEEEVPFYVQVIKESQARVSSKEGLE